MKWTKTLTRELPFHTLNNWKNVYFDGWYKLLGFGLKNVAYHSKRTITAVYRIKKEYDDFIKNLTELCLKNPNKIINYYDELEKLDEKIPLLINKKIEGKSQLREYIKEIKEFMDHYCVIYLIKVYSNFAITEEVAKKHPELVKKGEKLLKKAEWFEISKTLIKKSTDILNLPIKIVVSLTYEELIDYIDTEKLDYELAENRYNGFAWDLASGKWFYGEEADKFIQTLDIIEEKTEQTNILKGTVASQGKAKGEVVVVLSTEDFDKIKQGCVVVAHMTTPWYTPYLSKVQAIVTDEGGIGCHASIIARELNIPCIIGTKTATKIFKDGDLVEVDAEKGIVKKIK